MSPQPMPMVQSIPLDLIDVVNPRAAATTRNRLAFVVEAFRTLLADEGFTTLLRVEGLLTLPRPLKDQLGTGSAGG